MCQNSALAEVRESALESVSENLSDSLVAPLFWFVIAGLPELPCTVFRIRPMPCGVIAESGSGRVSGRAL